MVKLGIGALAGRLLLFGLLSTTGCGIFDKPDEDYYPVSVGSVWNYAGYAIDLSSGTPPDTLESWTARVRVLDRTRLGSGETVSRLETTRWLRLLSHGDTSYVFVETTYARVTSGAVLSYDSLAAPQGDTLLRLPLLRARSWHYDSLNVFMAIIQEDVTVQAGRYAQAWKVNNTSAIGGEASMWFANHVGLVQDHFEPETLANFWVRSHEELVSETIP